MLYRTQEWLLDRKALRICVEGHHRMAEEPADLIVSGGTIHTADDAYGLPQAFAARDGRFVFVGSMDGAMALRGPSTRLFDATGKTVLPGLVDAHIHLTNLGLRIDQVDLRGAAAFEEIVARAAAFAALSTDEWIVGRGWDQNDWIVKGLPAHHALSEAIPDRPVVLTRVDGHALVANARAMTLAGVDASAVEPPGGRIVRDASGSPSGLFVDTAMALIERQVPQPTRERLVGATRAAIAECNRWGVTALAEPGCDEAMLDAHVALIQQNAYSIRNHAMLDDDAALLERRFKNGPICAAYGGRLSIRAVKMYADGALGSRGAALLEPYSDDSMNRGLIVTTPEHLVSVSQRAVRAGFQPCIHAIGDRANRIVLDIFGPLLSFNGSNEVRARVEHAQIVAPPDVSRFAALGVTASMQATHALSDMVWARARLGNRIDDAYAWRRLLDAGAAVANGTDAPVEPVDTRRTFFAAIAGPSPPMTRREALLSMTLWAARANFQETFAGTITPGKYADFVVMDRDWMSVAAPQILETQILATYFGGAEVYRAAEAQ
jgi:predicted amidohydrolase YtcJ